MAAHDSMGASHEDTRPLLRTLLLVVAVVLAVAGAAVYGLRLPLERLVRQDAVQDAVGDALAAAKPRIVRLVDPEALLEPMTGARYEETDRLVRDYVLDPDIAWLKLWSPSGVVLYSTDRAQVGAAYSEYEPIAMAMAGETVWDLKERTESPQETAALGPVLEVYTPLYWDETGPPRAVLEVYVPYEPYLELLEGIRNAIAYAVGIVALAMVGGFYLVYRSGSGQVRSQRDTALASARQIEALRQEVEGELERSRERLEALRRASAAITLGDDPGEALRQAVEEAARMAGARYGALCGRDAGGNPSWRSTPGAPGAGDSAPPAWLGAFAQRTAALGASLRTADAGAFLAVEGLPASGAPGAGLLAVPVRSRDGFLGALCVGGKEGGAEFSRDDERLLGSFAVVIEVLLSNTTLYSAVSGERKTLAAIQESMVDGLVVMDGEGVVTHFNRAASEQMGVPVEEALGRHASGLAGRVGSLFQPGESVDLLLRAAFGDAPLPAGVSLAQGGPEARDLVVVPFHIEPAPGRRMTAFLIRDVTAERELERRRDAFVAMASHELRECHKITSSIEQRRAR